MQERNTPGALMKKKMHMKHFIVSFGALKLSSSSLQMYCTGTVSREIFGVYVHELIEQMTP